MDELSGQMDELSGQMEELSGQMKVEKSLFVGPQTLCLLTAACVPSVAE